MHVFEIVTPGTWLDYEDREWSWRIENLLRSLKSQFFEANLALNLFSEARYKGVSLRKAENLQKDFQRRAEIRQELEQEFSELWRHEEHWHEVSFREEVRFKREKWESGAQPREFEHNLIFIYARAFLYALDAFDKFLGVLASEDGVSEDVEKLHVQIKEAFPNLRGVRNSTQHMEDRSRAIGRGGEPLKLKPIENNMVNAPNGGVLILNSLNGSRYGSTMADGHYGEIDVSPESMEKLQYILQRTLELFRWRGPKQHEPSV